MLSWSDVRKASKKRKHLDRYFTPLNKLSSRSLEETSTSATAEDNTAAANDKRLNIQVLIISQNHCYSNQIHLNRKFGRIRLA